MHPTWGPMPAATAFVTGLWSFVTIRVPIGAAEAGLPQADAARKKRPAQ